MANPGQTITRVDGQLGLSGTADDRFLFVGVASGGTANSLATYYSSSALRAALGSGPVVEAAAWELDTTERPVDVLVTAGSVVATTSAVTSSEGGTPEVSVAGTPVDFFAVVVEVMLGGALGVGRFRYTLDGKSYSDTLTIPAGGSYEIPDTGLTLTFASATYVLGVTYSFDCVPATYNVTDLEDAWDIALAAHDSWPAIVFTGHSATASAAATIGASIAGLVTQLVNQFRYGRALVSTGEDTEANIITAWEAVESVLLARFAGKARIRNGVATGFKNPLLPYVYEAARRAAVVGLSTNPAWVGLKDSEALAKVSEPSYDASKVGSALYDAKVNAPTTFPGRRNSGHPEVLPTGFLMASPASSDYRHWQWCRVIDVFSDTVQVQQQEWINGNLEVMTDGSGRISSRSADALQAVVLEQLETKLVKPTRDDGGTGHISGKPVYTITRTNDVLTTGLLQSTGKCVPLANVEQIETELGFATEV